MDSDWNVLAEKVRVYLAAKDAYRERDSSNNLDAMSFAEDQLREAVGVPEGA